MDIVIIEGDSFEQLRKKLEAIRNRLKQICKKGNGTEKWLDNQDVCKLLGISKRTLQSYRDKGILSFTQIRHKCYYKQTDIQQFIEKTKQITRKA